jgi:hypothetical protein
VRYRRFAASKRCALVVTLASLVLLATAPDAARAAQFCSAADLGEVVNRPDVSWSACVVGLDQAVLETGYYQNASSVGQFEIAEYPNAQLRLGLAPNAELVLNPPTQVDLSGNHGKGYFSLSDPGVGLKYQLVDRPNGALDIGGEIRPPSTAASFGWQPDYQLQVDSAELVGSKLLTSIGLGVVDDGRIHPTAKGHPAVRSSATVGLAASHNTSLSLEIVDQASVARSLRGQSSGNLALREAISRHVLFDLDGGQTFNTSAHARPHYIGAGFAFATSR